MCLILEFTAFFQMHIKYRRKEGISMSVHTEPGGIFGNVVFQPEIFPGNNEVSDRTKMLCQNISLKRQYRDRLKAVYKRFNPYYNV